MHPAAIRLQPALRLIRSEGRQRVDSVEKLVFPLRADFLRPVVFLRLAVSPLPADSLRPGDSPLPVDFRGAALLASPEYPHLPRRHLR